MVKKSFCRAKSKILILHFTLPALKMDAFQIVDGWGGHHQGRQPWAVSSPPTATKGKRQFGMYP